MITPQSLVQPRVITSGSEHSVSVAASDDDRGSGRLSNQAQGMELISFRGSGRINPETEPSTDAVSPDRTPNYRGSGRLG